MPASDSTSSDRNSEATPLPFQAATSLHHSQLKLLLPAFYASYPTGGLRSELLTIQDGAFVVRALVQVGDLILSTGMATSPDIEAAEDRAKVRALESLGMKAQATPLTTRPQPAGLDWRGATVNPPKSSEAGGAGRAIAPPSSEEFKFPETIPSAAPTSTRKPDAKSEPAVPLQATQVNSSSPAETSIPSLDDASPLTAGLASSKSRTASQERKPAKPKPGLASDVASAPPAASTMTDLSDIIAKTSVELKRLGWTEEQGREHLQKAYGKRSRQQLTDPELLDFLRYLESQSGPSSISAGLH